MDGDHAGGLAQRSRVLNAHTGAAHDLDARAGTFDQPRHDVNSIGDALGAAGGEHDVRTGCDHVFERSIEIVGDIEGAMKSDAHRPRRFHQMARGRDIHFALRSDNTQNNARRTGCFGERDVALHRTQLAGCVAEVAATRADHAMDRNRDAGQNLLQQAKAGRDAAVCQPGAQFDAMRAAARRDLGIGECLNTELEGGLKNSAAGGRCSRRVGEHAISTYRSCALPRCSPKYPRMLKLAILWPFTRGYPFMNSPFRRVGAALVLLLAASPALASHRFVVAHGRFELDGKPFQIISGDMDYVRTPREYWRDRLRMAHALGINTVMTYVFWNFHEPQPGQDDFSGQRDVAEFIREAQQEGLYVILRPGPYSCGEWDLGGYPAWLLRDRKLKLRSLDPAYQQAASRWMDRLGKELAPLQLDRGGPIIAVQVENEYGSFQDAKENDHAYMEHAKQMVLHAGFTDPLLYTADGPEELTRGSLPELPAAIDFGTGDAQRGFAFYRKLHPEGPYFCAEYWAGWFDHWGAKHEHTDAAKQVKEIRWMLQQGYSVSMYMVFGGTSFGWFSGANSNGHNYQPDVTSYDYDAPIDEAGQPRPKYFEIRKAIQEVTGITPPPVPPAPVLGALPPIPLKESVSLWDTLPAPVRSEQPLTMEDLHQDFGYVLYRTTLHGPASGDLVLDQLHSYARVYLDGKLAGVLDRRLGKMSMPLTVIGKAQRLDILVENSGRVNFTDVLRTEQAGITHGVTFAGKPLTEWENYSLPFNDPASAHFAQKPAGEGPTLYRGTFSIGKPTDTFLDMRAYGKGQVWVNGYALGRYWRIGPQGGLYLPGAWLHPGHNEVVLLDLDGGAVPPLSGLDHALIDDPIREERVQ
jgi:beta-galactosidase